MPHTQCNLCSSKTNLQSHTVSHSESIAHEPSVTLCNTCIEQIDGTLELNPNHWHCLNEAIWSESPAVKVLAWRLLTLLTTQSWAQDLLDQMYLDEDVLEWAKAGATSNPENTEANAVTKDSNGTALATGDSVMLIKDLDVKGGGFTAKRGTLVKGITLTDDPGLIEGRINGSTIVLKTIFLKKTT